MELTRGEFCQFNLTTRRALLREFGQYILKKKVAPQIISVYRISGFYVEVFENLDSRQLEKIEPVINIRILEAYRAL